MFGLLMATPICAQPAIAQTPPAVLTPEIATDPVLLFASGQNVDGPLRSAVAAAIERHPAIIEAQAGEDAANAARSEVRHGMMPRVDIGGTATRTIASDFGNDLATVVERSQTDRTDVTFTASQLLFDFGGVARKIRAADARIRAADARTGDAANGVAMNTIGAFYDLLTYQRLVAITQAQAASQRALRDAVIERIRQGASAPTEQMRTEAAIARADARVAGFERERESAALQLAELTGMAAPLQSERPGMVGPATPNADAARAAADKIPQVRAAEADADAALQDARSARSAFLPTVSATVRGGRYGILEGLSDYDMRARVTISQNLFGDAGARANRLAAVARAQSAHADRIREEAERDAAIAWSEFATREAEVDAQRAAFIAAARSREAESERFRVAHGTLLEVLDAQEYYLAAAINFVLAVAQRDEAHYRLLARTGMLLDALGAGPPDNRNRVLAGGSVR